MSDQVQADELLTLTQAARVMNVSRSKAHKMAKAGQLPFVKLNCTYHISRNRLYRELGMDLPETEAGGQTPQQAS